MSLCKILKPLEDRHVALLAEAARLGIQVPASAGPRGPGLASRIKYFEKHNAELNRAIQVRKAKTPTQEGGVLRAGPKCRTSTEKIAQAKAPRTDDGGFQWVGGLCLYDHDRLEAAKKARNIRQLEEQEARP